MDLSDYYQVQNNELDEFNENSPIIIEYPPEPTYNYTDNLSTAPINIQNDNFIKYNKTQAKKLYDLSDKELQNIPHTITEIGNITTYNKYDLDEYIKYHPRVFNKKNALSQKDAMNKYFLNNIDMRNIPYNKYGKIYYYKDNDVLEYAKNKYGEHILLGMTLERANHVIKINNENYLPTQQNYSCFDLFYRLLCCCGCFHLCCK
jgi:hypothetical protein